ncbi:MAG TPA: tyrosine-type recombinase/integrase [Candidatus Acidoferrales bacterium]|nr:tyrosine-type recombinase/integrase [Candidatus Acidoferrales bacterium]
MRLPVRGIRSRFVKQIPENEHSSTSRAIGADWTTRRRVACASLEQPKTKRSARTIPIGTETAEIFAAIRPTVVDARALVFATGEGLPLERWNLLRKHLKPAATKLGLPGVTWHLLRHSHATMLDSVGTPIGTMQSLLGHSTPDITREIYLHAIPEEQRRAVESVERLLFGPKWTQVQAPARPASAKVN